MCLPLETCMQGLPFIFTCVYNFRSSAFRSHPLFPLLRDLVIADMNFHSPTFPFQVSSKILACVTVSLDLVQITCRNYDLQGDVRFLFQLISNLPADFNKLLQNYMQRNPASANYRMNEAVDNVIMDALRYAHKAFIGNIPIAVKINSCPSPLFLSLNSVFNLVAILVH